MDLERYRYDYRDQPATAKIIVNAADSQTEVLLIDWNLKRVPGGHGIGQLEIYVPPGIYKIRFQTANSFSDELVEVPPLTRTIRFKEK